MRRRRREVRERTVRDALVEALDDHGGATGRFLRLREADNHAEADEQREDKDRGRPQTLHDVQDLPRDLLKVARAHASPSAPPRLLLTAGTS